MCQITLHPDSGGRGTTVTVTGTGFLPNATVTLSFLDAASTRTIFASARTGNHGNFSATVHIPSDAAFGHGFVVASTDTRKARAPFLVTKECPTKANVTRSPGSGTRGTNVDVSGTGFCPSTRVRIRFRDHKLVWTTLATGIPVAGNGTFSTTVAIPSGAAFGDGTLAVYDASSHQSAKAPFRVTR